MLCSPFELQFTRIVIIEFWPSIKFCGMTALPLALVIASNWFATTTALLPCHVCGGTVTVETVLVTSCCALTALAKMTSPMTVSIDFFMVYLW